MNGTRTALLVGGLLLLGAGVGAYFYAKRQAHKPLHVSTVNPHRDGLEFATSPLTAMYKAPEGKTPCETAFNAYQAAEDTAKQLKLTSPFLHLAPHDEFLTHCNALTPAQQICLGPKYKASHQEECAKVLPSVEVRNQMFEPRAK